MKRSERVKALALRQRGVTYRSIMEHLAISKSTLWKWLKAEGLVETHPQRLTELKRLAQQKGAALVKARRLERTKRILESAKADIGTLSQRDLWLVGAALYWAEGSKQKATNVSGGVVFSNSDSLAIRLFVDWLNRICHVSSEQLIFDIYLHETADAESARAFWVSQLGLSATTAINLYWKRHSLRTSRHNTGDSYHGLMRVKVRRSTALNRTIAGWVQGIGDGLGSGATVAHLALDQKIPGSIPGSPVVLLSQEETRKR